MHEGMLRVHDWDDWQTYRSDRGQPPWIKVHRRVMRTPKWVALSDAQKGQLLAIWILAADEDGWIPADPQLVQKLCYMDATPDLEAFVRQGFLDDDDNVTSQRRHRDVKVTDQSALARGRGREEAEAEAEAETDCERWPAKPPKNDSGHYEYPEPFEKAWEEYPARDGSNPKAGAYKAFRARIVNGEDPTDLVAAAQHYRRHLTVRGQEGSRFVQQASTFYGPSEPFREFVEPSENGPPLSDADREVVAGAERLKDIDLDRSFR